MRTACLHCVVLNIESLIILIAIAELYSNLRREEA